MRRIEPIVEPCKSTSIKGYMREYRVFILKQMSEASNPFEFISYIGQYEGTLCTLLTMQGKTSAEITNFLADFRRITITLFPEMWDKIKKIEQTIA